MTLRTSLIAGVALAALFTAPAFAQNTVCSTSGAHAWIVPDKVFSVNAYPSGVSGIRGADLDALFAPYGVTISADPPDTIMLVDERNVYGGGAADPSLIWNLLGHRPAGAATMYDMLLQSAGNHPANFTLRFAEPVQAVRFVRAGLIAGRTGITHPEWTANAYDATGNIVARQHEDLIASYAPVPARMFDLKGTAPISSVSFYGDNHAFAAFTNLVIQLIAWCR